MREKLIDIVEAYADFLDWDTKEEMVDSIMEFLATGNNVGDKCDYCQEDAEGYRKMIGAFSITNPFHGSTWQIKTAHCKPRQIFFCPMCGRKLAEPPKGE